MDISKAMHRHADWVSSDMPVSEIARMMEKDDIGAVPVGKDDKLIGMITDRDIALRVVADHARTCVFLIGDGVIPGPLPSEPTHRVCPVLT